MRRLGRKLGAIAAVALATAGALAGGARGIPGELDSQFGDGLGGKVMVPARLDGVWWRARVQLAVGPGGFVVGNGSGLVRYLPEGKIDSEFGEGGRLALAPDLRFELADLAIDPGGRVVAIGTARDAGLTGGGAVPTVLRLLPDGSMDPSFGGGGGIVQDAFGLKHGSGLRATHGMLDPQGRILLTAGAARPRSLCSPGTSSHTDQLIARLAVDGSVDESFGVGGTAALGPLSRVSDLALAHDGGPVLAGPVRGCAKGPSLAVIRLRPDGSRIIGFAERGARTMTGSVAGIAVDSRNRILIASKTRQLKARDEHVHKVARLLPDGRFDHSFAHGIWVFEWKGPNPNWRSLTVDAQNRPILTGTLEKPPTPRRPEFHRWFEVMRLRSNGSPEHGFGWHGQIAFTRFDRRTNAAASEAAIDEGGRLLVGGAVRGPRVPGNGLAAARFHLEFGEPEAGRALRPSGSPAVALRPRAWPGGRP